MTEQNHRPEHPLHAFLEQRLVAPRVKNPGIQIEVRPFLTHLNLRGKPCDPDFLLACKETLGQGLPLSPNTFIAKSHLVCWLGPDEWLIITEPKQAALIRSLEKKLAGQHTALADVSGGQIVLQLSGPKVRDVLAKGCTLDFHPRSFKPGQCAQSGLAKAPMLVAMTDDQPSYSIVVRRSFADYAALWLDHAAAEFGIVWTCKTKETPL